jgi:hypothetical protein
MLSAEEGEPWEIIDLCLSCCSWANILLPIDSSSIWFVVASRDFNKVEALWTSLGQHIEDENYMASLSDWTQDKFDVFVYEQRPGDLIIIPSMAFHQVWDIVSANFTLLDIIFSIALNNQI